MEKDPSPSDPATDHHRIKWQPKPLPPKEVGQIKCPHCGMFKVTTTETKLVTVGERKITVQEVRTRTPSTVQMLGFGIGLILLVTPEIDLFQVPGIAQIGAAIGYMLLVMGKIYLTSTGFRIGAGIFVLSISTWVLVSAQKRETRLAEEGSLYGPSVMSSVF